MTIMRPKLSAVVLTHNNDRTIERLVVSLKDLVDEIVIVDDVSTDTTKEKVTALYPQARILDRKLDRFDLQRNFGIDTATGEWVLVIDSDEEMTPQLAALITHELSAPKHDVYFSYIENRPFGRSVLLKLRRPLLMKQSLRFEGALHEHVVSPNTGFLKGRIIHNSWDGAADWMDDLNHYSTHQAKKWLMTGRNYSRFQLLLIALIMPVRQFFIMFILQRRFKDGIFAGFLYPLASSAEWIFAVLKYYEMRYVEKQDDATAITR